MFGSVQRNTSKEIPCEANENEFESSLNSLHFPPLRTPLNAIPDPSQFQNQKESLESVIDSAQAQVEKSPGKGEASDGSFLQLSKGIGNAALTCGTPMIRRRTGKAHFKPGLAQSTPAKRPSNNSLLASESNVEISHSELKEDLSFSTDHSVQVESISVRRDSGDELACYIHKDDEVSPHEDGQKMGGRSHMQWPNNTRDELLDTKLLTESLEAEHGPFKELQHIQYQTLRSTETSSKKKSDPEYVSEVQGYNIESKEALRESTEDITMIALQAKMEKIVKELEDAQLLIRKYHKGWASPFSQQPEGELVGEQVEMEATLAILHLQEEVTALQMEFHDKMCSISEENARLTNTILEKEYEMKALCSKWERATLDLTGLLLDGSKSLKDASMQIECISCSFPKVSAWVSEHVERAAKVCLEKEETNFLLKKSLEDAQKMVEDLELKLSSLKGAVVTVNEAQQVENDESSKEIKQLKLLLNEKINLIQTLESELRLKENQISEAENCANALFLIAKDFADCQQIVSGKETVNEIRNTNLATSTRICCHDSSTLVAGTNSSSLKGTETQIHLVKHEVLEPKKVIDGSFADAGIYLAPLECDSQGTSAFSRELVQDLGVDIVMKKNCLKLNKDSKIFQLDAVKSPSSEVQMFHALKTKDHILRQIKDEITKMNNSLYTIKDGINRRLYSNTCFAAEDGGETHGRSTSCSTSSYDLSALSFASASKPAKFLSACYFTCTGDGKGERMDILTGGNSIIVTNDQMLKKMEMPENSALDNAIIVCLSKELEIAFKAFSDIFVHLVAILYGQEAGNFSLMEGKIRGSPSPELEKEEDEIGFLGKRKVSDSEIKNSGSLFTTFEQVHETMKEADLILNALLEANERGKQSTDAWKEAGHKLMVEKENLIKEIAQLKSSLCLKDLENDLVYQQTNYCLVELTNSIALLEGSFLQMQRDVEEWLKVIFSDVLATTGKDLICCLINSRSTVEDIFSEVARKGFALFVLCECHLDKLFHMNMEGFAHEYEEFEKMRNDLIRDNLSIKEELEQKENILKGLPFDFSLLQENVSNAKDTKNETNKLILVQGQINYELRMEISRLHEKLIQHRQLEGRLTDTESALCISKSDLQQAKNASHALSEQNAELRVLLKNTCLKISELEEQLEEQKELVDGLEKEILCLTSPAKESVSSLEAIQESLRLVTSERDSLLEQTISLSEKLEMASALADENEAIAIEFRQESQASKSYAEQKEEEVKILEISVEELECTINLLEKKVCEMDEDVEKYRLIKDFLECETQALRQRMLTVETFTEYMEPAVINVEQTENQVPRKLQNKSLELHDAQNQIKILEQERAELKREIKQCKEYISELVLHTEAQASQYQQEYKNLEAMVSEVKAETANSRLATRTSDRAEKSSRMRRSSSPFRCIAGIVQQMNHEKDQDLSTARLRMEELEVLATKRQKEICILSAKLAAAESMTHDVIRDLLGVKIDMTNYANLIEQYHVQKLVEEAENEESFSKEQEIMNLRKKINDLIQEKKNFISDISRKEAELSAARVTAEQLQERDQLLTAQNEMLKADKTNLLRKVVELDETVRKLCGTQDTRQHIQQPTKIKDQCTRVTRSERGLSHVNDELARWRRMSLGGPSHGGIGENRNGGAHKAEKSGTIGLLDQPR